MSFADNINKNRGQPATVRVGVVTAIFPLKVLVQTTEFVDVGVLDGYIPQLGDVVALLGQSAVSADGSSWLALGLIHQPGDVTYTATTVASPLDPAGVGTTSATYVPLTGSFNIGVAFVAPASGRVLCFLRTATAAAVGAAAWTSPQLRLGPTVGVGTVISPATDSNAIQVGGTTNIDAGTIIPFFGATPGTIYNVELQHRTTAGTSFWARRQVIVEPVP